jgi:transposase-like protein
MTLSYFAEDSAHNSIAEVLPEAAWLRKWEARYAKLCQWAEDNIEERWRSTDYRRPTTNT